MHTHELTLVPVVVVGHAEGADAALDLIACHADAISAAIIINSDSHHAFAGYEP